MRLEPLISFSDIQSLSCQCNYLSYCGGFTTVKGELVILVAIADSGILLSMYLVNNLQQSSMSPLTDSTPRSPKAEKRHT